MKQSIINHALKAGAVMALSVGGALAEVVKHIQVQGNTRVPEKALLSVIPKVYPGVKLSDKQITETVKALVATGWFSDVDVTLENGRLVVQVKEKPILAEIDLKGAKLLPEEAVKELKEKIGLKTGQVYDKNAINELVAAVEYQYKDQGYDNVKVAASTELLGSNRVKVIIKVDKQAAQYIDDVVIEGNKVFSSWQIKMRLGLMRPKIVTRTLGGSAYSEIAVEKLLSELQDYYHDQGYLSFRVLDHKITRLSKTGVRLTLKLYEGPKYSVGRVLVEGVNEEEEARLSVLKRVNRKISSGKSLIFTKKWMEALQKGIQKELENSEGAVYTLTPDVRMLSEDSVSVVFKIERGLPKIVRRIEFSGNQYTLDHVLRRELSFVEGQVLEQSKLDDSKKRLNQMGLVKNVKPVIKPSGPGQVDVVMQLEEAPSASANLDLTYNEQSKMQLSLGLNHPNFLGTGNTVTTQIDRTAYTTVFNFGGHVPFVFNNGLGVSYNTYYSYKSNKPLKLLSFASKTRTLENEMRNRRVGMDLGVGFPVGSYEWVNLGLGFSYTNEELGSDDAAMMSGNTLVPNYRKVPLRATWTHNSLDRASVPQAGFYQKFSFEYGLPLGNTVIGLDYKTDARGVFGIERKEQPVTMTALKSEATGSSYTSVFDQKLILNARYNVGYVHTFNAIHCSALDNAVCSMHLDRLPTYERFYGGGESPVRGLMTMGTKTYARERPVALGGNLITTASFNAFLQPMVGDAVVASTFVDGGYVYGRRPGVANDTRYHLERLDLSKWACSAGVQLQVTTPMAPLVFIWATPLKGIERSYKGAEAFKNDEFKYFQFTMRASLY